MNAAERVRAAADKAAFVRYRVVRTDTTIPHMFDGDHIAVVIQYDDAQITALRRAVDTMMSLLPDMTMLTGFVAAKSYYVVVIAPQATAMQTQTQAQAAVPVQYSSGNGGKPMALKYENLPKAITSFEKWLESVGRQYLKHSDETVVDYELITSSDENEVYVFMHSDEHKFTSRYILTFDRSLAVTDIMSAQGGEDCPACAQEYRDIYPDSFR